MVSPKAVFLMVMFVMFVMFVAGVPHVYGEETIVIDKTFDGREIKVRSGAMIRVELEQAGAAGYTWEIQGPDAKHFDVVNVKTPEPPEKPDLVGAPVKKIWLIRVKEKGRSELKFIHFRPWEGKEKAADSFLLKVRII